MDYLAVCEEVPVVALKTVQAHVRYMIEFQWCVYLVGRLCGG